MQVLDFRYRPARWQTCIGLVDDPFKTIVGDDGGLYYDYGRRGPEPYDNGQGVFGTRLLAEFVTGAEPGSLSQSLASPRVPIVVSKRQVGRGCSNSRPLPACWPTPPVPSGARTAWII